MLDSLHLTTAHTKNPYMAGKPASENHPRVKAGVLLWKGYEMKKYIPVDFDEKGKVILGRERNTPTSNKFIPTTWVPGGGDEGKQGLKSISISPAITTTPALDSLFPIYWEDLTDEEKQTCKQIAVTVPDLAFSVGDEYAITLEATDGWGVASGEDPYTQSITVTATAALADNYVVILVDDVYVGCLEDEEKYFGFRFGAAYEQK